MLEIRRSRLARRRFAFVTVVAFVAAAVPLISPSAPIALAAAGGITATNVTPVFLGRAFTPQISADGRFIGLADADNFGVRVGEPGAAAVQVALNGQGQVANNASFPGGLSADGRHVVFVSNAQNLTPTDVVQQMRVYTLDRDTDADGIYDEPGFTTLRRIPGRVTSGGLARADISATGRYVAFTQPDVDGAADCLRAYRYDRDTDGNGIFDEPGGTATIDVTVDSAGVPATKTGGCGLGISDVREQLAISADGQSVAFTTDFDSLVPGDTNNANDVIVRDIAAGRTIRVLASATNSQSGNSETYLADISSTGRYVSVLGSGSIGIYRYDRDNDGDGIFDEPGATSTVVVSSGTSGGAVPAMSADGGTVAYWSPTGVQVWRASTGLVNVLPVTVNSAGWTKLNASGNVLALVTSDSYDPADVDGQETVYRVELSAGPPVSMSVSVSSPATTLPGATDVSIANISPQVIRGADFDVSAAPGGGVKRAPGGGVKRAPGGGVKRAPGGGVKRADELSHYAQAFSRVPSIDDLPLSSIPIDGGWEARLPPSLQGRPLQSLTFGQVLTAIGPNTVQLEQLDLSNTPMADLSAASYALGTTPLNGLFFNSTTSWCTELTQLTGKTCFGGGSIGGFNSQTTLIELEMRADTRQLLADHPELTRIPIAINIGALHAAGAPILQETFATLGLGVSRVGDLPVSTAIAATPGIGSLTIAQIGNTSLILDCVVPNTCSPSNTLASLQANGRVQARARLRDFTTLIPSKKLDDIAAALPSDVTLNDVLIGLLEAQDFPWEAVDLVTSGIQEAALSPALVNYSVAVSASGGTGPFDGDIDVVLPAGWRFVAASASVTPAVALPLAEPTKRYTHTDTQLGFRLIGFMPGIPYTIHFTAIPGFELGTVAANATVQSAGVVGTSVPAPITVVEPADAGSDPGSASPLQADHLYFSYSSTPGDTDLFRFNPPAGQVVSVWLSNFDRDADLSLYGPALDAANAAGSPSGAATRGAAPATAPLGDEGTTGVAGAVIAEPQNERDVPLVAGTTLLGTSANGDVDVEGVSAVNANLIQVSPYRGATSTGPYVLRVRVDPTDVAAACTYTRTGGLQGPALDINSLPADLETAFLVQQRRLGDAMGPIDAQDLIDNWLTPLTEATGVAGAIISLDQVVDYSVLNSNWCSADANNDVARQVAGIIDQIRDARPTLRHIVIVGGDDIIPMARIDDVTRTGNESEYADEILSGNGGQATPLTESLATRHFLTDDPYGDVDPIAWFNRRLYVPDLAVGRLVETHDEIVATVQAYLDPNGDGNTGDTGIMPASSTYMTGYDFLADGATVTRDALNTALAAAGGVAPSSVSNIDPPNPAVTKSQMLTGAAGGRAVGLFGHFSHDSALTDEGFHGSGDSFTPAELANALRPAATPATARLVFSIGCHSGLSVSDSDDFVQKVLGTGAAYVAMTTYGYGAQGTVGLNESLMTEFAGHLDGSYVLINRTLADTAANRRYLTVGEAFVSAKQQYFSSQGLYGPYDEKSLEAATFYGLPMFRVGQSGPLQVADPPESPTSVGGSSYSAVDQSQTFAPTAVNGANGTYYTVGGFDPQVTANRPVQPRFETDVTALDGTGGLLYAKGVLVTHLETLSATTVDPVVTRPVLDSAENEPELGVGDVAFPSVPASITTYTDPLGYTGDSGVLQRQKLVIVPGQFLDNASVDTAGDGTQVLYSRIDTRITYSDSSDWDRPTITSAIGTLDGDDASFTVAATDGAGVQRVLVLYRTNTADWAALDLTLGSGVWQGTASVPGATTFDYLVQVVDVNGNIATSTGKGRGLDPFVAPVPDPAVVSIAADSSIEGDTGSAARSMLITLDRPAPGPITVDYAIAPGTAAAGSDYSASNGTASFGLGDLSASIPITVLGDTSVEAPETLVVTLTAVAGAGALGHTSATFTIVDDDAAAPPDTLVSVIDPAPTVEGDAGTHIVDVGVTLSPVAGGTVVLSWSVTGSGTASASDTAAPKSGTVTVPANTSSATIPITIVGDTSDESDESVIVQVTSSTAGVSVVDGTAVITIVDDDTAPPAEPTVSIGDVTVNEGAGTASATVTLSATSASPVSIPWNTVDGSAVSPDDHGTGPGTLIITSGLTGTITVPIVDDGLVEPTETFTIVLGTPSGATITDGTATVTIVDNDTAPPAEPTVSIGDVTVNEGAGTASATVTLSATSASPVSIPWNTVDGSAVSPDDHGTGPGTLIISSGLTGTITVPIVDDGLVEPTESFTIVLGTPSGATVADGTAVITILDNDVSSATPQLSVADMSILEASSGTHAARVRVSLDHARTAATSFTWRTLNGTALAPGDYTAVGPRTATIPAGATSVLVTVNVRGDTVDESPETFSVVISAPPIGVGLADATGAVTIVDDDPRPVVSVADASLVEGNSGTRFLIFNVTLSAPTGDTTSVGFSTADGTARTSNNDYRSGSGTVTFTPGQTTRTISVRVNGDRRVEPNETMQVRLRAPVRVTLGRTTAVGTIVNDD